MQWKNLKVKQNEFFTLDMNTNIHLLNMREAKILNGPIEDDFLFDVQIELKPFLLRVRSLFFLGKWLLFYIFLRISEITATRFFDKWIRLKKSKMFPLWQTIWRQRPNDSLWNELLFFFFAKYCKLKEYQIATSGESRRRGSIIGPNNTKYSMKAAIFESDSMNECQLIWNAVVSVTALRLSAKLNNRFF